MASTIHSSIQLGLDTFGDMSVDDDGRPLPAHQVLRDVVEQAVVADAVGIDAIGLGEHHRDDFAISAPDVVLAAIAGRTSQITLGTAVTVLSSDDPVRVFQRFATLDAVSGGRAEITLGRGSFIESFPLFGYELADYHTLFEEKLELFARLREEAPVTWSGTTRAPLVDADVVPKTSSGRLPTWVGVGGSPESAVRAATHGFGMMLAIIGGAPSRFRPFADLYRSTLRDLDRPSLPIGVHAPGFVADSDDEARELLFPHFKTNRDRIGAERGWGPATRMQFDAEADGGALFVGSPETVARKIADTVKVLGLERFDLKYANGPVPHGRLLRCIELYGTKVAPMVRELLAEDPAQP